MRCPSCVRSNIAYIMSTCDIIWLHMLLRIHSCILFYGEYVEHVELHHIYIYHRIISYYISYYIYHIAIYMCILYHFILYCPRFLLYATFPSSSVDQSR